MTGRKVRFHRQARSELRQAAEYYHMQVPGLGVELAAAVEQAVAEITAFPELGSAYLAGTRRRLVRGFPFSVVYYLAAEELVILAVAHEKRRPGYWRGRSA